MSLDRPWTIGVVGHGIGGDKEPHTRHPERCADHGHPGNTYNPWLDKTWCCCGEVIRDGNTIKWPKPTQCGGALSTCNHPEPAS